MDAWRQIVKSGDLTLGNKWLIMEWEEETPKFCNIKVK